MAKPKFKVGERVRIVSEPLRNKFGGGYYEEYFHNNLAKIMNVTEKNVDNRGRFTQRDLYEYKIEVKTPMESHYYGHFYDTNLAKIHNGFIKALLRWKKYGPD